MPNPNILAAPRKWSNKVILFKIEPIYGADALPTGAVNWIEARNVSFTPMENDTVERNIEMPYMGNAGSVVISSWAKLSFDVAMAPSGSAGVAPKWAPLLMACGTAETLAAATSSEYNLVSSGFTSVSAYINIDGTLHKLFGLRGDVKAKMAAKGVPMFSFSFDANYVSPTESLMPTITRTGWMLEEGVNSVNTTAISVGAVPLSFQSLDWGFGNKVTRNDLPGPQRVVEISDRKPTASVTVMAPALSVFNPFTLIETGATIPVTLTHGSALGKKIKIDIQARVANVDYDQIEGKVAYKLSLEPKPMAGNDEIALTCL